MIRVSFSTADDYAFQRQNNLVETAFLLYIFFEATKADFGLSPQG